MRSCCRSVLSPRCSCLHKRSTVRAKQPPLSSIFQSGLLVRPASTPPRSGRPPARQGPVRITACSLLFHTARPRLKTGMSRQLGPWIIASVAVLWCLRYTRHYFSRKGGRITRGCGGPGADLFVVLGMSTPRSSFATLDRGRNQPRLNCSIFYALIYKMTFSPLSPPLSPPLPSSSVRLTSRLCFSRLRG